MVWHQGVPGCECDLLGSLSLAAPIAAVEHHRHRTTRQAATGDIRTNGATTHRVDDFVMDDRTPYTGQLRQDVLSPLERTDRNGVATI